MADELAAGLERVRTLAASKDNLERGDAVRLAEALIDTFAAEPLAAETVARIRIERAKALSALDHDTEALAELTTVLAAHGDDSLGAEALAARFRTHRWLGHDDEALADHALLIDRFGAATDPNARLALCEARDFRLGWLVNETLKLDDPETAALHWWSAVQAADDLVVNHADDPRIESERAVARGLLWKARSLRRIAETAEEADDADADPADSLRLQREARAVADQLFARFAHSRDAQIRESVADSEVGADAATADAVETLELTERGLALATEWSGIPEEFFARSAHHRGWALAYLDRDVEAADALAATVAAHRGSTSVEVRGIVANAWAHLAELLQTLAREDEAERTVLDFRDWADDELLTRPDARRALSRALASRITACQARLTEPELTDAGTSGVAVTDKPATQSVQVTAPVAAYIDAVDEFAARFAHDPNEPLRADAAHRLYELGHDLRMRGHFSEAETAYRTLIVQFADEASPRIGEQSIGSAMLNLGFLLLTLTDRPADAVAVYDQFLARFGDSTSASMRATVAKVNASRQAALTLLYDRGATPAGIERDALGAEERERLRATIKRANHLTDEKRHIEAVAAYDEVIDAYPSPRGADLRMRVCDAMVRKGYCLGQLERWQDSVRHHDAFLAEFGADVDMTIEKDLALGMGNRAFALDHLDRTEQAVDAYGEILRRWGASSVPYLIHQCARAAWKKGYGEEHLGRTSDAEQTYASGVRYLRAEQTNTRVEGAKAATNLSVFLRKRNRSSEAAPLARQVIDVLGGVREDAARTQVALAYLALARALAATGDTEGARVAYEWCLNEGSKSLTERQRTLANEEFLAVVGGPFKGAWSRIKRSFGSK